MIIVAGRAILSSCLCSVTGLTIGLGYGRKLRHGLFHIQTMATRATILRDDMQVPGMIKVRQRRLGWILLTHGPTDILSGFA